MKLYRIKGTDNTVRRITADESKKVIAIVGTVADLLDVGIFDECDAPRGMWACISPEGKAVFECSRADAIAAAGIV